jgi:hypothetical protein
MNPLFPIYIVSKGRWESRLTSKSLEAMKVPYYIVVEEQEYEKYCSVIAKEKVLILPKKYLDEYDTFDDLGFTKSKGPGAARNFAWDHSMQNGFSWHWVMDDNLSHFYRLNKNLRIIVNDGTIIRCMEYFVLRYKNIAMAGPQYRMFCASDAKYPPFVINTRIYSCNLIRNDVSYRWRGRYNEDTDLSLRMLKDKWCTVQFNAFLQGKIGTQTLAGGNTEAFYAKEGTYNKSKMLCDMHPDVSTLVWRFNRWHHYVDYLPFKKNKLIFKDDYKIKSGINEYNMKLVNTNE